MQKLYQLGRAEQIDLMHLDFPWPMNNRCANRAQLREQQAIRFIRTILAFELPHGIRFDVKSSGRMCTKPLGETYLAKSLGL